MTDPTPRLAIGFCEDCGHDLYWHEEDGCGTESKKVERDRIRAELISWIRSLPNPATINRDYFLDQLDRICPPDLDG